MSAIGGVWTTGSGPDPQESCARVIEAQAMYGPHAGDQWNGGEISLGRRLFRTLPEDAHDRQPLLGGGGRFVIAADLRLDNRDELEAALDIRTDMARTFCDAAVLLAAWEKWGENCFDRLVGCYAFALWDSARRALVLARDPLGQRPLYYHRGNGFWAFATMPKGLHALEEVPRAPDETYARDSLALMPERGTRTFFADVERLEPGCFVTVSGRGISSARHWQPVRRPIKLGSNGEYVEALREQLDRAVRAQLRGAKGKIGAHLSGGLDSSAVAATAARLLAPSGGQVVAFTSVPREGYSTAWGGLWDEGALAAATAALYPNLEHVLVRPTGRPQIETLDRDYFLFDRPIQNPCNVAWMHEINRQSRDRGVAIMLTGLLGNLTLSYDGLDLLSDLLAHGKIWSWLRLSRSVVRSGTRRWRGVLYRSFGPWIPGPLWRRLERMRGMYGGGLDHYSALNPALYRELDYERRARALGMDPFFRPGTDTYADRLNYLQHVDPGNYVKGFLGGWGVDQRDPTADRRLTEFCLNIPTEQFIAGGRPRSLIGRALADRVPHVVLSERRLGYQAADWWEAAAAGRDELARWIDRLENCPPAAAALDLPRLRRLVANWPTDGWDSNEVIYPYRFALLRGLAVGHFLHSASGSNQ
jgi:asparagine synthase (glutamine-hydrolysing)